MTKARTLADNFAADINAVTADAPLTGGGTSGTITVGIQAGTTAQSGAVQLTDSTASTSTTTAATPNSVKSAYDLANAAIAKSTIDAKGDLLVGTANDTVSRLAVASTAGYLLSVDSAEATGLKWAAPAAGSYTQIGSTLTLSGTTNSFTSIPGTYNKLVLYVQNVSSATNSMEFQIAINNTSGNLIIPGPYRWGTDAIALSLTTDYIRPIAANMLQNDTNNAWYVEIENYASTTAYKSIKAIVSYMSDTSSKRMTFNMIGIWTNNSAVTSIGLNSNSPTISGGTARLYGVK